MWTKDNAQKKTSLQKLTVTNKNNSKTLLHWVLSNIFLELVYNSKLFLNIINNITCESVLCTSNIRFLGISIKNRIRINQVKGSNPKSSNTKSDTRAMHSIANIQFKYSM